MYQFLGDCAQQFLYYDTFFEHLKECHSSEFFCNVCNVPVDCSEKEIEKHLIEQGFMEFQCVNCNDSFNQCESIRNHMVMKHPSKVMLVATRRSKFPLIFIGDLCDYSHFKFFKCTNMEQLNLMSHKLTEENPLSVENNLTEFLEQISPVSWASMANNTFMTFENYQMQKSTTVTYKCITENAANEIAQIERSSDTIFTCDCLQIFEIPDNKNLTPYLDHLDEHNCFVVENEKDMLEHRCKKHSDSPIVYLKNGTQLIRCTLQCTICNKVCETKSRLIDHYTAKHTDSTYVVRIKRKMLVFDPSDTEAQWASPSTEDHQFSLVHLFYSSHGQQYLGSKSEAVAVAVEQHYAKHDLEIRLKLMLIQNEQLSLGKFKKLTDESINPQRMYIFECVKCPKSLMFDSITTVHEHTHAVHSTNEFAAKKLVACAICKTVNTFEGIERHYLKKHENMHCCTVNAVNTKLCGSCSFVMTNFEHLSIHYQHMHAMGETFTDFSLERLGEVSNSNASNFKNYSFVPACCAQMKYGQLNQLAHHILFQCKRDFICECCNEKFSDLKKIVEHYRKNHEKKTTEEVIKSTQNIKQLLNGSFSMFDIIFPNGLTVTRKSIKDTNFDLKLMLKLAEYFEKTFWPLEATQIRNLCD